MGLTMARDSTDWYERLTPKERQVLEAYAELHSYESVARALGKSESAVDQQLLAARRKMGVTSTAEAMYLLAERTARLRASIEQAAESMKVRDDGLAPSRMRRAWMLAAACLITISSIAILLATTFHGGAKAKLPPIDAGYENPSDEELARRVLTLRKAGSGTDQMRARVAAVTALCDRAWLVMWGPREDSFVAIMSDCAPDIRTAFNWAVINDADTAIRIVGNGHRLFSRVDALSDWSQMIDQALALKRAKPSLAYGRALCGVALAHWKDDPGRGFQAAQKALEVFKITLGSEWDQANAERHIGLCCVGGSLDEGLGYYRRALASFNRLGDSRGRAQTMLSLGQAGYDDKDAQIGIRWDLLAAYEFRKLRNKRCLNEAVAEISKNEKFVRVSSENISLFREIRSELASTASDRYHDGEIRQQMEILAHCIRIDILTQDHTSLSEDVELILINDGDHSLDPEVAAELLGYDEAMSIPIGRSIDKRIYWHWENKIWVAKGRLLTPGQALAVAARLFASPEVSGAGPLEPR